MIEYLSLDLLASYAYQKKVYNITATGPSALILGRDNRRVKVLINFSQPIAIVNGNISFDGNDNSSGRKQIVPNTDFEMQWFDDFTLVQSEMWLNGLTAPNNVTITTIVATQARRERNNNAIDAIRLASEKIEINSGVKPIGPVKRKPYFNWW